MSSAPTTSVRGVIAASVKQANKNLRARDLPHLPEGITPHSLWRAFAGVLHAIGENPGVVMDEEAALRALVEGTNA